MKQIIGSLTFSYFHAQSSLQGKGPRHASAVHQYFFLRCQGYQDCGKMKSTTKESTGLGTWEGIMSSHGDDLYSEA